MDREVLFTTLIPMPLSCQRFSFLLSFVFRFLQLVQVCACSPFDQRRTFDPRTAFSALVLLLPHCGCPERHSDYIHSGETLSHHLVSIGGLDNIRR